MEFGWAEGSLHTWGRVWSPGPGARWTRTHLVLVVGVLGKVAEGSAPSARGDSAASAGHSPAPVELKERPGSSADSSQVLPDSFS